LLSKRCVRRMRRVGVVLGSCPTEEPVLEG
jgi:hypothetical protein